MSDSCRAERELLLILSIFNYTPATGSARSCTNETAGVTPLIVMTLSPHCKSVDVLLLLT
jgi:hypothetical protein